MPIAKNPARTNATHTPNAPEATADQVMAEICVAVSNPKPKTSPVIKEDPNGPIVHVLVAILPANIADPVLPHLLIEYMFVAPIVANAMAPIILPHNDILSILLFVALPTTYIIKSSSNNTDAV